MSYFEYFSEDLFSVLLPYLTYKDFDNLYNVSIDDTKKLLDNINSNEEKYRKSFQENFPKLYSSLLNLSGEKYYNTFWRNIYNELIKLPEDVDLVDELIARNQLTEKLIYDCYPFNNIPKVLFESFFHNISKELYDKIIFIINYNDIPWYELYQLISAVYDSDIISAYDLEYLEFDSTFIEILSDMKNGYKLLSILISDKDISFSYTLTVLFDTMDIEFLIVENDHPLSMNRKELFKI